MTAVLLLGVAMALAGLVGLGWCLREAMRVRRQALAPEAVRKALSRLQAVNLAAVGVAFLGLAMVAVAAILR